MADQLRVAGLRLVIEGADEFQTQISSTDQSLKENREALKQVDAQYGRYNDTAEKTAAKQKLLTEQLTLQEAKLKTLKDAYAQYASQENATEASKGKMRLAIMKQETAMMNLNRTIERGAVHLSVQEGAEARAAKEKEAYANAMGTVANELATVNSALASNGTEIKKLDALYGSSSKNPEKLARAQELLTEQLALQQQKVAALQKAKEAYSKSEGMDPARLQEMTDEIDKEEIAQANLERQLRDTTEEIEKQRKANAQAEEAARQQAAAMAEQEARAKSLAGRIDAASKSMIGFGERAIQSGKKVSKAGGTLMKAVTVPLAAGFTYAAKEAIDFENAFADVVKTVDASKEELAGIRIGITDLSVSGLVTQSKEEIAEVAAMAGQLNIHKENIVGFSRAMLQMGDATNLGAEDAASGLAKFINITGSSQTMVENLGSAIVALGNNTATQEDAILDMGLNIAAAGRQAKMTDATIMGIAAAMSSVGMEAQAGGSAVSKVILDMDMAAAKGERAMKKYADVAGMSAKDFTNLWKSDSSAAFTGFIQGLSEVEKKGGNLSLTLEKLGYTERRTRDAMMRAALASGTLTGAIDLANTAYAENTALADEAAAKNSTFANRMKILGNRADALAMGFGEQLMPHLEQGLTTVNGLVEGFAAMTEEQQKTVLTMGAVAIGIGPVVKGLGLVTQAVGYASKGFGMFLKLFQGPVGWVALAVAGIATIGIALSKIKSPMDKLREDIQNVSFDVDEQIAGKINSAVSAGVEASTKEYEIKIGIQTEIDSLSKALGDAAENGDINYKEKNSLSKQMNAMVADEIKKAREELDTQLEEYKQSLREVKDINGERIFTDADIENAANAMASKTESAIAELEGYQAEFDTLLNVLYKQTEPVTAAQIAELDALLQKIAGVRAEIKMAQDEAILAARAQFNLTTAGRGSEESVGSSLGYVQQTYERQAKDAQAARDKALAAIEGSTLAPYRKMAETERVTAKYVADMAAYGMEANEAYAAIFGGEIKRHGLEGEMTRLTSLGEELRQADFLAGATKSLQDYQSIVNNFGNFESSPLAKYMTEAEQMSFDMWKGILAEPGIENDTLTQGIAAGQLSALIQRIQGDLLSEAKTLSESEDLDVITTLFDTMFNQGAFSADSVNIEGMNDAVAGIFALLDLTGKGEGYGYNFTEGFWGAVGAADAAGAGAGEALADAAIKPLDESKGEAATAGTNFGLGFINRISAMVPLATAKGKALGEAATTGLNQGINAASPSRASAQSAGWFVEGFVNRIQDDTQEAVLAARNMGLAVTEGFEDALAETQAAMSRPEVLFDIPIAGDEERLYRALYGGESGGSYNQTGDTDNSVNVTFPNAQIGSPQDAQGLAVEIANIKRRQQAGYGS